MFKFEPSKYNKHLKNNIPDNYQIDRNNITIFEMDNVTADMASKLKIADIIGKIRTRNSNILFKVHKCNFSNKTQSILITPTKSEFV